MSDDKKYYYLKLKDNFFDSDAMIVLESQPDGYIYSNILLKMYLRSLKYDGKLFFNEKIPYNATILAQVTRHHVGIVEKAIRVFIELNLIEILENGAIFMADIQNFIGESSTEADRKRLYRSRIDLEKKSIAENGTNGQTNVGQMSRQMSGQCPDKNPPEIEIEIEKEIKIERELKIEKEKELREGEVVIERGKDKCPKDVQIASTGRQEEEKKENKEKKVENFEQSSDKYPDDEAEYEEKYQTRLGKIDPAIKKLFLSFCKERECVHKKPVTARSGYYLLGDLWELSKTPEIQRKVIEQAISRGYQSFYPVPGSNNPNRELNSSERLPYLN